MSLLSKIKEVIICLNAGRVTLPYPFEAKPVPERFRGRPIFIRKSVSGAPGAPTIALPVKSWCSISARRCASSSTSASAVPTAVGARMSVPKGRSR